MDTSKCRALITVLESGSLAHAAEKLGYTTSGISRMMLSLETELGFSLLIRSKAGVKPTSECESMLPMLTQLATLGETCEQQAALIRGIEVGTVRVGSAYRSFYTPLAKVLDGFSKVHPGVQTSMIVRNSTPLIRALERGKIDLAIVSLREGDFDWTPLLMDPMIALVPANHPLVDASYYPMARLAEDPFIELYPDDESDNSRVLAKYDIHPKSHNAVLELREARELVAIGVGVTLINNIYADWEDDRVRTLPLFPTVEIPIGIATPRREFASPAARAFMDYAIEHLKTAAEALANR